MVARENLRLGLEAGGGGLPGPADLALNQSRGLLQTPVVDLRTPGTPKSSLDILASPNGASTNGSNPGITSNNSNGGAPTLTTPTLTPTTLRNIEQMFAESDPHEPPHHYEHAAGFAPPIISPTSGNSYAPLGGGSSGPQQVAPLNCHRSTPPPPSIPGPPDLCPLPSKPLQRPTNLSLSRPPPLLEAPIRRPTCLLPSQQQPADLSLPSPTRGDLSISLVKPQQVPLERPTLPMVERPPGLALTGANLLSQKLDMMDKLLKAVAASASQAQVVTAKQEPVEPIMSRSPPAYEEPNVRRSGGGGRRKTEEDGLGPEEEDRRAMRRERNKQAAARCRKRRMDLTSTLQGEVDQWEEKVRGLKEELLQLEAQKKGLEAYLRNHKGPCKVARTEKK